MSNGTLACSGRAPTEAPTDSPPGDPRPRCSRHHVLNCQFGEWYPLFKHCTIRSVILDLSERFVQYLQQDGVILPKGFAMSCGDGGGDDSDGEGWDEDETEADRVRNFTMIRCVGH